MPHPLHPVLSLLKGGHFSFLFQESSFELENLGLPHSGEECEAFNLKAEVPKVGLFEQKALLTWKEVVTASGGDRGPQDTGTCFHQCTNFSNEKEQTIMREEYLYDDLKLLSITI